MNDRHVTFHPRLTRTARDTSQQYLDRSETIENEDVKIQGLYDCRLQPLSVDWRVVPDYADGTAFVYIRYRLLELLELSDWEREGLSTSHMAAWAGSASSVQGTPVGGGRLGGHRGWWLRNSRGADAWLELSIQINRLE